MTKLDLTTQTTEQLLKLFNTDPARAVEITAEFERRQTIADAKVSAGDGDCDVTWNSSGGMFIVEHTATTPKRNGKGLWCGQANIPPTIAKHIIADTPMGERVRQKMRDLLNAPAAVTQAIVAAKAEKKANREAKEIDFDRKELKKLIAKGFATPDALVKFDEQYGTSDVAA